MGVPEYLFSLLLPEPIGCEDLVATDNGGYVYGTWSCEKELSCYGLLSMLATAVLIVTYIPRSFLTRSKARLWAGGNL